MSKSKLLPMFLFLFGLACVLCGDAEARRSKRPTYQVRVVADRADAVYDAGDKVTFEINVTKANIGVAAGEIICTVTHDGAEEVKLKEIEADGKPHKVTVSVDEPGFLRCTVRYTPVNGKAILAVVAVAVGPTKIRPSLAPPADFDEFWADQKKKLADVPLNAKLTSLPAAASDVESFDVQIDCLGDAPVSGYLAKPRNVRKKTLPAVLWVHGAGVRGSVLATAVAGAKQGMLSLDINAHGIPNGKPASYYRSLSAGKLKNYRYAGRENRETSYFLGMYLRLQRAIDFLTSQPEWDGKVLIVRGHSQGGGQSLVAAGLDSRVTAICVGVPAMCDHTGPAIKRIGGWPKLVPIDDNGQPDADVLRVAQYFDAVNFAARTKAAAVMSVGFVDAVCPPTTCYAAFNVLQGRKLVINRPTMGHAAPADIREAFDRFIKEHVSRVKK